MMAAAPAMAAIVPAVLAFHQRAVRFLAVEAGVRQFLDVGTGLPRVQSGTETAQSVDPSCRVVYVDNDPMVLSHVRAFWRSTSQGAFAALDAKLTDPAALLAAAAATLDFRQPVAVLLPSTLPFIPDTARVTAILAALLRALSPGSYLALCHVASDLDPPLAAAADELEHDVVAAGHPPLARRGSRPHRRPGTGPARFGAGERVAPGVRRGP